MKKTLRILSTLEKAQEINFSGRHYGTIAEIGAGQEVARWFFQAVARPAPWPRASRPMT